MLTHLCETIRIKGVNDYEKDFITWKTTSVHSDSVKSYYHHLISSEEKKTLVQCTSNEDVDALSLNLQKHCERISRPIFYIDSPDELVCSSPFIKTEDYQTGVLTPGPGGPLHNFLTTVWDKANPPVLLINYNNFEAEDLIRLNAILDEKRIADGTEVPEHIRIIGLINKNKKNGYRGSDFYSRFDSREDCFFSSKQLQSSLEPLSFIKEEESHNPSIINLYHAQDWKERLLGKWTIKEEQLVFEEGELVHALEKGSSLIIKNGLWNNPKFLNFWQNAINLGKITHLGQTYTISSDLKLIQQDGYSWKKLSQSLQVEFELTKNAPVLNPTTLASFFQTYECNNETHTLNTLPGILSKHKKQVLPVNLTAPLNKDEWGRLLDACQMNEVKLVVHQSPATPIPHSVKNYFKNPDLLPPIKTEWEGYLNQTMIIQSSDVDTTVAKLCEKMSAEVIDISECEAQDLLSHLKGELNDKSCRFVFEQTQCALLKALEENRSVILKGKFSAALADGLASLLLERFHSKPTSKLVLVSSDTHAFEYLPIQMHQVTLEEKKECLLKSMTENKEVIQLIPETCFEPESLSQLKARASYLQRYSTSSSEGAWEGMKSLQNAPLSPFDELNSKTIAQEFVEKRLSDVNSILAQEPYVFLTGLTGVGKSTFIEKYIKPDESITLYQGEDKLLNWATDLSKKRKILFIDEANLALHEWIEFEGLFNQPPTILYKGQLYNLTPEHKVIFAGNPLNYGDDRKLASFFARHGNALIFKPMPQEFIYEDILKPVFANHPLESESAALCKPILDVYEFIFNHADNEILISPRELQMMALQVLTHADLSPVDPVLLAKYYAYHLAKDLVPQQHQGVFEQYRPEIIPPTFVERKPDLKEEIGDYRLTSSRLALSQQLDDLVALQAFKQSPMAQNDVQKYGGLGGIIIEGEPGIGKSRLIIQTLVHKYHYRECREYQGTPREGEASKHIFYCMPASMKADDKKALLLKAFHEGAMVIVDEMNSSNFMERFVNALLMGKDPEGNPPKNPGFTLIGTQNPAEMGGRREASTALKRRLIQVKLPPYSREEMLRNTGRKKRSTSR